MTDIVLNTNAFWALLDDEVIRTMTDKREHLYVTRCAWRKELTSVFTSLINILFDSTRKLGSNFHEVRVSRISLPNRISTLMSRNGADDCDKRIASLAFDRQRINDQRVPLVSDDSHFLNVRTLFEHVRVDVITFAEFRSSCCE